MLTKGRVTAAVFTEFLKRLDQRIGAGLRHCRRTSDASGKVRRTLGRGAGGQADLVFLGTAGLS